MADLNNSSVELSHLYKSYFKRAFEGLMLINKDLSIDMVNPAAEALLGYESGELHSRSILSLIPKDLEKVFHDLLTEFDTTPTEKNELKTTLQFITKEQTKKNIDIKVSNHIFAQGSPQLLVLFSDKTENCRTLSYLKEVQDLYESALETIGDAFVCLDRNWQYKYANSIAKDILAHIIPEKDYTFKTLWEVFPQLIGTEFEERCNEVMKKRQADRLEILSPLTHNRLEIRMCPYDNGIAILSRDLLEIKMKEAEIKKSKELFKKAFHSSPVALSISKFPDGIFIEVNASFVEMFGFSEESEILGKTPTELQLIDADNQLKLQRAAEALFKNGSVTNLEVKVKQRNSQPIFVLFSAELIDFNDEAHILATMIDITQKKENEQTTIRLNEYLEKTVREKTLELTKALEKEKENNDLKSRFVSTASHEFRTPLTGLLTSVSILEQYTQADKNENLSKHFSRIKTSVNTLTDILNDFLSLEKLERGKLETSSSSFDIRILVQQTIDEMKGNLKKGQKIKYSHSGDALLHQDKRVLHSTLLNLLSNACKYSAEGKQIDVNSVMDDETVKISIKDRGIGIPEKDQQNLFSLFFRAKNTETIQGTGLGLNIVKKYLGLLGGSISFTSVENEGSTFTITFPKNKN